MNKEILIPKRHHDSYKEWAEKEIKFLKECLKSKEKKLQDGIITVWVNGYKYIKDDKVQK